MTDLSKPLGAMAHVVLSDSTLRQKVLDLAPPQCFATASKPSELPALYGHPDLHCLITDTHSIRDSLEDFLRWLADPLRAGPVLLLAPQQEADVAASSILAGLDHYLRLPVSDSELRATLGRMQVTVELRRQPGAGSGDMVFLESPRMQAVYGRVQSIAPLEALNVLLSGETGTGKQEVARLLHLYSKRRDGPFAEVDCAALPANLVESELFGHEAGAFTDARSRQSGLLEAAQKGTLFLDEVGELPLEAQAKLLRALELRRFRRVGGREEIQLDLRLVSASNRDLAEEVRRGRFRADLYYRLSGVGLHLPPLRERREDVDTLAAFFYGRACTLFGRQALPLGAAVLQVLRAHPWPGNIRELKSVMHRIAALAPVGAPVSPELVRRELELPAHAPADPPPAHEAVPSLRQAEEHLVRQALLACRGNKTAAAKVIGVSKPTFFRMLKQFGIKD